jgi:hypothetical protein
VNRAPADYDRRESGGDQRRVPPLGRAAGGAHHGRGGELHPRRVDARIGRLQRRPVRRVADGRQQRAAGAAEAAQRPLYRRRGRKGKGAAEGELVNKLRHVSRRYATFTFDSKWPNVFVCQRLINFDCVIQSVTPKQRRRWRDANVYSRS